MLRDERKSEICMVFYSLKLGGKVYSGQEEFTDLLSHIGTLSHFIPYCLLMHELLQHFSKKAHTNTQASCNTNKQQINQVEGITNQLRGRERGPPARFCLYDFEWTPVSPRQTSSMLRWMGSSSPSQITGDTADTNTLLKTFWDTLNRREDAHSALWSIRLSLINFSFDSWETMTL